MDRFPKLRIIAAHLGGYCFWEEALTELAGRELYLDTSSTLPYVPETLLREIIRKHGAERLLFGSDYPLNTPGRERQCFDAKLGWLNSGEKDAICGGNAQKLLAEVGIRI
jgi:predicted TIM-barrel fold metal-dependent hydrolase